MARDSQIRITVGDRPLSGGLERDAELVDGMVMMVDAMSPGQMRSALRMLAQRLHNRAGAAAAIEDAAKARMGASDVCHPHV